MSQTDETHRDLPETDPPTCGRCGEEFDEDTPLLKGLCLRCELEHVSDMRDGAMAACERLQHELEETQRSLRIQEQMYQSAAAERAEERTRVESLRLGIECLVADEVISAGRARELHGMSVEEQREFWRRHPNDLYFADDSLAKAKETERD